MNCVGKTFNFFMVTKLNEYKIRENTIFIQLTSYSVNQIMVVTKNTAECLCSFRTNTATCGTIFVYLLQVTAEKYGRSGKMLQLKPEKVKAKCTLDSKEICFIIFFLASITTKGG